MENEKVKELRERFAKIQYAASLEKDLQQELDETKDLEKRISLTKRIEEVRKTNNEAATTQIIEEAEKGQEEAENKIEQNRAKIETLKSENRELEEKEKAFTKEILENEGIMELKKANPSSKIYISAKEENEKLLKSRTDEFLQIKINKNQIKKLEDEIESLEDEILDFDDLLSEIRGIEKEEIKQKENPQKEQGQEESKEEVQQQEDEMWEQYRLEQEKSEKEQERRKQEEIDRDFEEKQYREETEEIIRDLETKLAAQEWINSEEENVATTESTANSTTKPVQTQTTIARPIAIPVQRQEPTKSSKIFQTPIPVATTIQTSKDDSDSEFQEHLERIQTLFETQNKPEKPLEKGPEDEEKNQLKEIKFWIRPNGSPEYYIEFIKDGEIKSEYYDALLYITKMKSEDKSRLVDKKIRNPEKYFDIGLEKVLEDFDVEYGTDYTNEYLDSMKEDAKVEDRKFDLIYDFSDLSIYSPKNSQKLRWLRNIAKANEAAELADYYKPKNILKRIEARIKNSKFYSKYFLPAPVKYETVQEPTNEQIKDSFEQLYDEPGFDIEEFAKQNNFSDKTASEYKALQGKKGKEFRESLKTITETKRTTIDPDFEDISKTVEEVKKEQGDKKEKSGWEIW